MAKKHEITLYKFSELDEKVKERLISLHEVEDYWDAPMVEEFEIEAEGMGIQNFKFQYSGFWSQGDGASFTGHLKEKLIYEIIEKESELLAKEYADKLDVSIVRNRHNYSHENTVCVDAHYFGSEIPTNEERSKIFDILEDWKKQMCFRWYERLQNQYDILTGPFEIKKQFEALGEVFLEDGRILSLEPEPTAAVYDRIYLRTSPDDTRSMAIEYIDNKEGSIDHWRLIDLSTGEVFEKSSIPHDVIHAASVVLFSDNQAPFTYVEETSINLSWHDKRW